MGKSTIFFLSVPSGTLGGAKLQPHKAYRWHANTFLSYFLPIIRSYGTLAWIINSDRFIIFWEYRFSEWWDRFFLICLASLLKYLLSFLHYFWYTTITLLHSTRALLCFLFPCDIFKLPSCIWKIPCDIFATPLIYFKRPLLFVKISPGFLKSL